MGVPALYLGVNPPARRVPTFGELAGWWAFALFYWLWGLVISESAAEGIAEIPQPDQITWVLVFRLLPLGPVFLVAGILAFAFARRRLTRTTALVGARIFLAEAIILIAIALPKPA